MASALADSEASSPIVGRRMPLLFTGTPVSVISFEFRLDDSGDSIAVDSDDCGLSPSCFTSTNAVPVEAGGGNPLTSVIGRPAMYACQR